MDPSGVVDIHERIVGGLNAAGDPVRAEGAKRYLKSELEFIGVATPPFRRVVRGALRGRPELDRVALRLLAERLWAKPVFELRAATVEALTFRTKLLVADDLDLVERLLREGGTWALVDSLAIHVAGSLVERFPELNATLDRWATDADFWLRRAAMLALLLPLRRGGGDFKRFARYADAMLDEREFFIRKAIGWVLRETAKRRPQLVARWLEPRLGRVSGVTLREAVKPLPAGARDALLAGAWAGRRGAFGAGMRTRRER
jgi:3-methyladenine DNA glycosylase AlkD